MEMSQSTKETNSKRGSGSCVRFTDEEYKQVTEDSQATGHSIPTLLKSAYFSGRRARVLMSKEDQVQWYRELRHWGNNLNQLAKKVNSGLMDGWCEDFQVVRNVLMRLESLVVGVYGSRHV